MKDNLERIISAISLAKLGTNGEHKLALEAAEKIVPEMYSALLKAKEAMEKLFLPMKDPSDFMNAQTECKQALSEINKILES